MQAATRWSWPGCSLKEISQSATRATVIWSAYIRPIFGSLEVACAATRHRPADIVRPGRDDHARARSLFAQARLESRPLQKLGDRRSTNHPLDRSLFVLYHRNRVRMI